MKISGIIPLRNAVRLGYPYHLAIFSLRSLCDEIVVLVDPTSEDDTLEQVKKIANVPWCNGDPRTQPLGRFVIIESPWNMSNHRGHTNCEISIQTAKACAAATGDWVLSLQADEVMHEGEVAALRKVVEIADERGITGIELRRPYFYGSLEVLREDWTLWILRLFKRGRWKPDVDGAMRFDPCGPHEKRMFTEAAQIYHYSRMGDPKMIAERVRNLDKFFHSPRTVQAGELPPYDFGKLRQLDTYVHNAPTMELPVEGRLSPFPLERHPASAREYFKGVTT